MIATHMQGQDHCVVAVAVPPDSEDSGLCLNSFLMSSACAQAMADRRKRCLPEVLRGDATQVLPLPPASGLPPRVKRLHNRIVCDAFNQITLTINQTLVKYWSNFG